MHAGLVADTFSVERGTGIARYAQALLAGLPGEGIAVTPLAGEPSARPGSGILTHAFMLPWRVWRSAGDYDLLHAAAPVAALSFPLLRTAKVVTFHDLITLLYAGSGSGLHARAMLPRLYRAVGRDADRIIAISEQTGEEIVRHLGIPREKITVIPPGIDPAFHPVPRQREGPWRVGTVGHMDPRKDLDYLLIAFRALRDLHPDTPSRLVLFGGRPGDRERLLRQAVRLGIHGSLEMPGFVPEAALPDAYRSLDIFVLSSAWEGFGFPVLEAQRCGIPVVIRSDAQIPAEVAAGCVKARSPADMAACIHQLMADSSLRERIIREGLDHARAFTWERCIRETARVYREAVADRSRTSR